MPRGTSKTVSAPPGASCYSCRTKRRCYERRLKADRERKDADRARDNETTQRLEAERARGVADTLRTEAETSQKAEARERENAERTLYFNRVALADRYRLANNITRAEELLDACPPAL